MGSALAQSYLKRVQEGSTMEQAAAAIDVPYRKLGPFTRVESPVPNPVLTGAVFSLPIGKVSDVLDTDDGMYVVRVLARTPADTAAFRKDLDAFRTDAIRRARQDRARNYLEALQDAGQGGGQPRRALPHLGAGRSQRRRRPRADRPALTTPAPPTARGAGSGCSRSGPSSFTLVEVYCERRLGSPDPLAVVLLGGGASIGERGNCVRSSPTTVDCVARIGDAALELPDPLADGGPDFRQPLGAEHQQHDHHDDHQFGKAEIAEHTDRL